MEIFQEVRSILVPSVIPADAGTQLKVKFVERQYAFDEPDIPREKTQYLKVVYSAKHGFPSPQHVNEGGKFFQKIFGAKTSPLESFLIKRRLMGPCWLRIRHPKDVNGSTSHCKLEFAIEDPKFLRKLDDAPPSPPLVVMAISMKTIVNVQTHTHEIVTVSTLVHKEVQLDGPTEFRGSIKQDTCVRQLGNSAGSQYPRAFPHDLERAKNSQRVIVLRTESNERALLSWLFMRLNCEDPDVIVGHNILGFDLEVLLTRAAALKVPTWSKIGRLRRSTVPKFKHAGKTFGLPELAVGRLLGDTYLSSKEYVKETMYSLTNLAMSQLKQGRREIDPIDVPRYFNSSQDILQLAQQTALDAQLVQKLFFKLQVLPLTKQLTNISGNLWAKTMRGARAERIEYLLLHEFHALKFLLPEKKSYKGKKSDIEGVGDDDEGAKKGKRKADYKGGLVLDPKTGLYDSYILLLDFNSLYPSIIQEYNLCFTTINWPKFLRNDVTKAKEEDEEDEEVGEAAPAAAGDSIPPIPDSGLDQGVLPRVIKSLVERRRSVKGLLKNERDETKREQLNIRQMALKLTANSMYGCLGFSHSRFHAKPIAALVTAMGRETLSRTVDVAQNQLQLNVIYGDTDSIMINTNIPAKDEFEEEGSGVGDKEKIKQVKELGNRVKREVNKLYRSLELEVDGIFKCMLLLKKKKYAALVVSEKGDALVYDKEMKGLDLVRRDWCVLSRETGKYVIDQILSGVNRETVICNIHTYLEELAKKMRDGELDIAKYVITKGLSKAPNEYPDAKNQPHLQVALAMMANGKAVNVGDHIPYVICDKGGEANAKSGLAEKACHPDDAKKEGYKIDIEWYLSQQILPPIARLCEPMEGTSQAILAERLGLDGSRFHGGRAGPEEDKDSWSITPICKMDDSERFKDVDRLKARCSVCKQEGDFPGVFYNNGKGEEVSGLICTNENCRAPYWGAGNPASCFARLFNRVTLTVRSHLKTYYDAWLVRP